MKATFYFFFLAGIPFAGLAQNTCNTAIAVSEGTFTVAAIDGAEVPDPICADNGAGATAGEWYVYTPTDDYTVTVTTDLQVNDGGDTRFHVYTGVCGSLVCFDGDDDGGTIGTGFLSTATFNVTSGQTYYIAFDNRWSSDGFDFELQEDPLVVPIDPPVTFTPNYFPSISGDYQISIADMNGDYLDDIVTVSSSSVQIHYQQISGAFTNTTIATSMADYLPSWSMAIGDIDKNGFNDMVYGGGNGVTFMKADATGSAYTEISGPQYVFSQRSNFVDINNDGHLDAFVCHDVDPNVYYINDGTGTLNFNQGGLGDHPEGGNYGSVWIDYDNDGDQDLFIAKCRGGASTAKYNELHRNDGGGTFTDVSMMANMYDPVQTWSSAWNDYDNDGYMDALIGASSTSDGTHKLMHNQGDGTFLDITAGSGWEFNNSYSIEHVSYDFDNDGFTDVMGGGNKIMFNDGDMSFTPHYYGFGSGAIGDLNNDGFLDVQNGNTVYFNNGNDNNWIKINLQGIASNYNGIGARVELYTANGKQIRDVRSGEGFRYMNTLNVHFGIGTLETIDSVLVLWPSGTVDVVINPTINEPLVFVEGSHPMSALSLDGNRVLIYPNPTSSELFIEHLEPASVKAITIRSYTGAAVMNVSPTHPVADVSSLSEGLYIVTVELTSGERYSETFVKR